MRATLEPPEKARLRRFLEDHFNLNELKNLAFDLDVDCELFSHKDKSAFPRELIEYFERRDRLGCLVAETLKQRPDNDLARLLAKLPACSPSTKIQIIMSEDFVEDVTGLLDELAARFKLTKDEVVLVGAARGSVRLLISIPEKATDLQVLPKIRLGDEKSEDISIVLFSSLDSVRQRAWRWIVCEHPPILQGSVLRPTFAWQTALEVVRESQPGLHGAPPKYVAAIDQGTTSTRFMVFDHAGQVVSVHQMEHEQIYPKPGWVEHDPMEIWARTQDVIKAAMEKNGVTAADLAAVGVTNQRETTIVWNPKTGKPYYNAIVWQDTRTKDICDDLAKDGGQDRFRPKVGLPLATYFSGPKIKWILENVDGVRAAAEKGEAIFGNIDTWVIWNLTGGVNGGAHVTDVSNASRTMLMNLNTLDWDDEILKIMGIPRKMLPAVRPSSDPKIYGYTMGKVPVCGDLGDQQAALVGQTCFSPGEAKNTYGTGCFMLLNTGTKPVPSKSGLLTTLGYKIGDEPAVYCLEGSIAITGALVQWLRDNLKFYDYSKQVEDYAKQVPDSDGIYFVPAFSGLFAPYWQSDARGVIVGLTRFINKNHISRAALEATAYQTRDVLDAMEKDSGVKLAALKVDGGMVYNDTLMQFQSDILNVPVIRPKVAETTALGASYAAGLAVGFWDNLEDTRKNWQIDHTWKPAMDEVARAKLYKGWLKAVQKSMHWLEE